jgi:hypothetical protein
MGFQSGGVKATLYIEWPITSATKFKFFELMSLYDEMDDADPEVWGLVDQIRSLPGYPNNAPPDSDILLVVTDHVN